MALDKTKKKMQKMCMAALKTYCAEKLRAKDLEKKKAEDRVKEE